MSELEAVIDPPEDEVYGIASVCRLTGLSAPGLRMWEKRHQAVSPTRTETGRRQYTRRDIQRLTLLKTLCDRGDSISTIVSLPIADLEKRLEELLNSQPGRMDEFDNGGTGRSRACRIVVVGSLLGALLEKENSLPDGAATLSKYRDIETAEQDRNVADADLLVIEMPAFFLEDVSRVQRLLNRFRALRAIVVYAYAQHRTIEKLTEEQGFITAIRAPVSTEELKAACAADIALTNRSATTVIDRAPGPREIGEEIPQRRFSQRQLAKISQISSTVDCECPHHLAALLEGLNGFESYSEQCENRNAADAKIHAYLHQMTAHARATVEDALKVLIEFEGIDVGEIAPDGADGQ